MLNHRTLRIGLIGAGAIAWQAYLPLFRKSRDLTLAAVVDPDAGIRHELKEQFPGSYLGDDLDQALTQVDAVLICAPNHLHYSIAKACLAQGKHILCEKPVTTRIREAEELLQMVRTRNLIFAVAQVRRFYPAVHRIKDLIARKSLGPLTGFDFREGTVFSWPTVSGYLFDPDKAGGGVLMDMGVHLLDLLLWWLEGEPVHLDYQDDSLGGLEAFAELKMGFGNGVSGSIRISRLSVLHNFYSLRFQQGSLHWSPFSPQNLYVEKKPGRMHTVHFKNEQPIQALLADFRRAVLDGTAPRVPLEEALRPLRVIEQCYRFRKQLPLEWLRGEQDHAD